MKLGRQLNNREVEDLQTLIVNEHYIPTLENFSLHIYESQWIIEGQKYVIYKPISKDYLEVFEFD